MTEPPHDPLLAALDALHAFVVSHPEQTLHRMAENAVIQWTRVMEGKDSVQPRLNASGYMPSAFHLGMEARRENQIDPVPEALAPATFSAALNARRGVLRERLERFFGHDGYRGSAEQCDQMLLEVARFSRFLGACCLWAERSARAEAGGDLPAIDLSRPEGSDSLLYQTRFHFIDWEPYLNEAVVTWQRNSLEDFTAALQTLRQRLDAPAAAISHPLGFPFRAQGRPRQRILSMHTEPKLMRGKSMFELRFSQMLKRLEAAGGLPLRIALQLDTEVRQFLDMAQRNRFLVSSEPSFQHQGRPGLTLIRGRPATHPLVADPSDFFKKALLFANGTYTVAGGSVDPMYLQLRQMERFFRFEHWASVRGLREPLDRCLVHWEGNRWDGFTGGMLELAARMRPEGAA
jgi:hypothetical protein